MLSRTESDGTRICRQTVTFNSWFDWNTLLMKKRRELFYLREEEDERNLWGSITLRSKHSNTAASLNTVTECLCCRQTPEQTLTNMKALCDGCFSDSWWVIKTISSQVHWCRDSVNRGGRGKTTCCHIWLINPKVRLSWRRNTGTKSISWSVSFHNLNMLIIFSNVFSLKCQGKKPGHISD